MNIKEVLKGNAAIVNLYEKQSRFAVRLMSHFCPIAVSKYQYKKGMGRALNLKNPTYFNEKLMWLKFYRYTNNPLVTQCIDKYRVREYVEQCGLGEILNDLIGVWDRAEDVRWDTFPERFVIKCNHGCGFNIICRDKSRFDTAAATKKLRKWLKSESWTEYAETNYKGIPHKIICEKYLQCENDELPNDYKFFCFNGEPKYIISIADRDIERRTHSRGFFDLNWNPLDYSDEPFDADHFEKPSNLEHMIQCARILSKPFPFVRVDLYQIKGKTYFGELTFTPYGCLASYYKRDVALKLGQMIRIDD